MNSKPTTKFKKKNLGRPRKPLKNSENSNKKTKLRPSRAKTNLTGLLNPRRNGYSPEATLEKRRNRPQGPDLNKTSEMRKSKTKMSLKKTIQEKKSRTKTMMTVIFESNDHMIFSII
jgi:hypothetical protein